MNTNYDNPTIEEIINYNLTYEESVSAIDFLKSN